MGGVETREIRKITKYPEMIFEWFLYLLKLLKLVFFFMETI